MSISNMADITQDAAAAASASGLDDEDVGDAQARLTFTPSTSNYVAVAPSLSSQSMHMSPSLAPAYQTHINNNSSNFNSSNSSDGRSTSPATAFASEASSGSVAKVKYRRQTHSCDRCRVKKRRCDAAYPACSNCLSAGAECTFIVEQKKRGPKADIGKIHTPASISKSTTKKHGVHVLLSNHEFQKNLLDQKQHPTMHHPPPTFAANHMTDYSSVSSSSNMPSHMAEYSQASSGYSEETNSNTPNVPNYYSHPSLHNRNHMADYSASSSSSLPETVFRMKKERGHARTHSSSSTVSMISNSDDSGMPDYVTKNMSVVIPATISTRQPVAPVTITGPQSAAEAPTPVLTTPLHSKESLMLSDLPDIPTEFYLHLIQLFFLYFHSSLPIMSEAQFFADLLPQNKHHPMLLNVIYSIGCLFSSSPICLMPPLYTPQRASEFFANRAAGYISTSSIKTQAALEQLSICQATLLLSIVDSSTSKSLRSFTQSGMGIRLAQKLDLAVVACNKNDFYSDFNGLPNTLNMHEIMERKCTWSAAFIIDTYLSITTGMNFIINENDYLPSLIDTENLIASNDSPSSAPAVDSNWTELFNGNFFSIHLRQHYHWHPRAPGLYVPHVSFSIRKLPPCSTLFHHTQNIPPQPFPLANRDSSKAKHHAPRVPCSQPF